MLSFISSTENRHGDICYTTTHVEHTLLITPGLHLLLLLLLLPCSPTDPLQQHHPHHQSKPAAPQHTPQLPTVPSLASPARPTTPHRPATAQHAVHMSCFSTLLIRLSFLLKAPAHAQAPVGSQLLTYHTALMATANCGSSLLQQCSNCSWFIGGNQYTGLSQTTL